MDTEKTQLIGTADYPLDPALALTAEACPACQASIGPGEQFCPRCGYQRGTWGASQTEEPPKPAADAPYFLEAAGGTRYGLQLGEVVLGRGEVDIQLPDSYLSRRHVKLTVSETGVSATDLGSSNGTYIDEGKLLPDVPVELKEGAVLQAGQTALTLRLGVKPAAELQVGSVAKPEAEPETEPPAALPQKVMEAGAVADEPSAEVDENQAEPPAGLEAMGGLDPIGGLEPTAVEIAPATSPWVLALGDEPEFYVPYGDSVLGRKPDKATLVVRTDGYVSGGHARLIASETTLEVIDLGSTNGTFINGDKLEPGVVRQLGAGDVLRLGQTEFTVQYNEVGEARSEEDL